MNPAVLAAVRASILDWRREADGSRRQADEHARIAREHRADADRAEKAARELEEALDAEGIAP